MRHFEKVKIEASQQGKIPGAAAPKILALRADVKRNLALNHSGRDHVLARLRTTAKSGVIVELYVLRAAVEACCQCET